MTITAQVKMNGQMLNGAEIGVFTEDGECRANAVTDEEGRAYITIPGDEECQLTFKVAVNGQVFDVTQTVDYEVDADYGSYSQPYTLTIGEATGITDVKHNTDEHHTVYDLSGRKYDNGSNAGRKLPKGVYIDNGNKKIVK
jgi:hypothetical protein